MLKSQKMKEIEAEERRKKHYSEDSVEGTVSKDKTKAKL